jgi:hypothetical protein
MFDQAKGNLRPVGVRLAENQSTEQAPTMGIVGISDVEWKYMKWGDERGIAHEGLVFMAKDADGSPIIFYPPNTEGWFKSCKPFAKDIQEQFKRRYQARTEPATIPDSDDVSVMEEK